MRLNAAQSLAHTYNFSESVFSDAFWTETLRKFLLSYVSRRHIKDFRQFTLSICHWPNTNNWVRDLERLQFQNCFAKESNANFIFEIKQHTPRRPFRKMCYRFKLSWKCVSQRTSRVVFLFKQTLRWRCVRYVLTMLSKHQSGVSHDDNKQHVIITWYVADCCHHIHCFQHWVVLRSRQCLRWK